MVEFTAIVIDDMDPCFLAVQRVKRPQLDPGEMSPAEAAECAIMAADKGLMAGGQKRYELDVMAVWEGRAEIIEWRQRETFEKTLPGLSVGDECHDYTVRGDFTFKPDEYGRMPSVWVFVASADNPYDCWIERVEVIAHGIEQMKRIARRVVANRLNVRVSRVKALGVVAANSEPVIFRFEEAVRDYRTHIARRLRKLN